MSKLPFRRILSREIFAADVSGLGDAVRKTEAVLDLGTAVVTGHALLVVEDQPDITWHRRVYEAADDFRNWLETPAPVVRRGGTIVPVGEYILLGAQGAIVFHAQQPPATAITADFTRVTGATVAPDQTLAPPASPAGTIRQLVSWLANRVMTITGAANWWDAPATTLAAANAHVPATTGIHGVGTSTVESALGAQAKVDTHAGAAVGAAHTVGRWPGDRITTVILPDGINLNTVRRTGFYDCHAPVNRPPEIASWLYLRVHEHSFSPDLWLTQTVWDFNADRAWSRRLAGNIWQPWVEVESVAGAQAKVDTRLRNDGGDTLRGGLNVTSIASPAAPTFTVIGATGTTTYRYRVSAQTRVGETAASPETTITNGNATLSATNLNRISWAAIPGAVDYRVWRTFSGGTPATTGAIATVAALTVDDTGLAAAGVMPTTDTSGAVGVNLPIATLPTHAVDINDNTLRLRTARTPASATAAGAIGEICWDATHVYVCVAANTWRRAAITTW
ncbi:MAG: hypothetical protein DDT37_01794 [Firmicutes bacterium]|nr:hypothetical protein [candidate division NPL-UPA2 bacterium]